MNPSRYSEMAKRLATLPLNKQLLFREKLAQQGIDSWSLPIVPFISPSATDNVLANYPLSLAQQRFIVAEEMSEHALYNLCSVLQFDQGLNVNILNTAIILLAKRHQVLRTSYQQNDKGLWQPLLLDKSPYDDNAIQAQPIHVDAGDSIEDWCQKEYESQLSQPFNLRNECPFRVNLHKNANHYWLFFTIHHIAFDAWSAQQLVTELSMLYGVIHHQLSNNDTAEMSDTDQLAQMVNAVLPELSIQYQDYAAWQEQWLAGADYTKQQQYWATQLNDLPEPLKLPQDRQVKPQHERNYSGAIETCHLGDELSQVLRQAANQQGSTLYIYLQTAFSWLLAQYTQQTDFCFGSSIANRDREELNGLIGPLLNTLVIRHRLNGNPSFSESLLRTRDTTAEAFDAKDYPFEHLSKVIDKDHSAPLFSVMFVHVALPTQGSIALPDTQASIINPEQKHARFDLTLRITESGDNNISLDLEYSRELFNESTIKQWLAHTLEIIRTSITSPELRLSELTFRENISQLTGPPLLEKAQLLTQKVAFWAQNTPKATALETGDRAISYQQLQQEIDTFAFQLKAQLHQQDIKQGDPIGLCLPRGTQQITGLLASWRLGLVCVLLDPRQPADRLKHIIHDARVQFVLVNQTIKGLSSTSAKTIVNTTANEKSANILPIVQKQFTEIATNGVGTKKDFPHVNASDPAYIIYTSGSTGKPKGVVISHGAMSHYAAAISQKLCAHPSSDTSDGIKPASRWLTLATVAADLGFTSVLAALYQGQTLLLPNAELAFDPPELANFLSQFPADYLKIVPSHLKGLLSVENPEAILPRHTLILGGEGLDYSLYQKIKTIAPNLRIVNHYGPSETTVGVSAVALTHDELRLQENFSNTQSAVAPLGYPLAQMTLEVRNTQGKILPKGAIGELYIAGPQLAQGYWQLEEQTDAVFINNNHQRYYRSGDLVRINDADQIEYFGRIDDQIKRRGYRLELGEVSAWLNAQPEIDLSIAMMLNKDSAQVLVTYIQLIDKAADSALEQIKERMRAVLPNYMLPDQFVAIDQLPLTDNGKIDRQALSALEYSPQASTPETESSEHFSEHEALLASLWKSLLNVDTLTRNDDFFALGGDSILSLQLIGIARKQGLVLKPADIVHNSRLVEMAALLSNDQDVSEHSAEKQAVIHKLITLYTTILAIEDVRHDTDFFQAGGDSILCLQLIGLARSVDLTLSPKLFLQSTTPRTPAALANEILAQRAKDNGTEKTVQGLPLLDKQQRQQPQPLSASQQRIWFMQQFNPNSSAYNVTQLFDVKGVIHFQALEYVVQQLTLKHEVLRCRYFEKDGKTWQQLLEADQQISPLTVHRVSQKAFKQQDVIRVTQRVFNLHQGHVFAIDVFEIEKDHYQLLINLHHIVTDGWSMGLLVQDFLNLYQAYEDRHHTLKSEEPQTHAISPSYLDWAAYQQSCLDNVEPENVNQANTENNKLQDYWQQRLQGVSHSINLPVDHAYPNVQTSAGKLHEVTLEESLTTQLDAVALQHKVTPFTLYLAAFNLLLWRYTGETDFAVGIPVSGREHVDCQNIVGVFINTLASRHPIKAQVPFSQWLRDIAQRNGDDLAHQSMPLERLLDSLSLERNLSRPALFQTLFNYQSDTQKQRELTLPELELTPLALGERAAKYELSVNIFRQEKVSLQLEYNTDLFESTTADRFAGDYISLLSQICQQAESPLNTFLVPSMLQSHAHGAIQDIHHSDDFIALFEAQVQQQPKALALIADDRQLSYEALNQEANRLAHWLVSQGVGPEQLVAFCLPRDSRLLITLLAIQKAGAAYLPLDPSHPPQRLRYIVEHASASLCLCDSALMEQLAPTLSNVVLNTNKDGDPIDQHTMQLVDIASIQSRDTDNVSSHVHPNHLAYVLYTSGSTGAPKGVQLERAQFANFLRAMEAVVPPFTKALGLTTITFDIAGLELCLPLVTGAAVVLANDDARRDDQQLAALIKNHEIDLVQATPASWRLLQHIPKGILENVTALAGGEALDSELANQLNKDCKQLINVYGPTETTVWSSFYSLKKTDAIDSHLPDDSTAISSIVPIGRPLLNNQCYVLDEQLQPVPTGVVGELYIAGHGVARGYQYQGALTAERFLPNPFCSPSVGSTHNRDSSEALGDRLYRTGDQVKWLADGELYFVGRADHQVKLRGLRIELGEIEATLLSHQDVKHAALTLQGEQLIAYYVNDEPLNHALLAQHLSSTLPDYMLPHHYQRVDEMPLNSNGKVDRNALPSFVFDRAEAKSEAANTDIAARELTEQEQKLADIWQQVLNIDTVGPNDNFFFLGGHSLMAVQMRVRLEEQGIQVPLKTLFEHPTLSALAKALDSAKNQQTLAPKIPHAKREDMMPLSNAQQRIWFMQQLKPSDTSFNMNSVIELQGNLDINALQLAVNAVVNKHEILRVTYHEHLGEGAQRIHDELSVNVAFLDIASSTDELAYDSPAVEPILQKNTHIAFDLSNESPLKVFLYRIGKNRYLCQLVQHHIASDGWSSALLMNDLATAYAQATDTGAETKATQITLTPLDIQYVDYAHWQHQQSHSPQQQAGLHYWRSALAGMPPQLALPFKKPVLAYKPTKPVDNQQGDAVDFSLSAELTQRLKQLAKDQQCSLFMVLMGAFSTQLHHHTRSQDITIGTDVANRPQAETEALIGFFVNLIAVRTKPNSSMQFSDYLQEVKSVCLDGFEHQNIPFDRVVDALKPPRIEGVHPLIQALLVMQNMPSAKPFMGDVAVTPRISKQAHSKFDMALFVSEVDDTLSLRWVFRTALFDRSDIEHLSQDLCRLLDKITEQPNAPLATLALKEKGNTMTDQNVTPEKPAKRKLNKLSKLGKMSKMKKASPSAETSLVNVAPMKGSKGVTSKPFPLLVENTEPGLDPFNWAKTNKTQILQWLETHAGIVFRGFNLPSPVEFEQFCQSMYPSLYGQYGDLPKKEQGKKIYKSTPYPNDHMIMFHNESSHQYRWPRRQWFYCEVPAEKGGATPIVDCREMFAKLPEAIREKLARKQLRYTRNFSGLDVSWQHFFKTENRSEVEAICSKGNIAFEWYGEDNLRIGETCPAIIRHPITGDMSFFNQIQLHHHSFLENDVREHLLRAGGEEGLPRNVYYGDGEPLEDSVVALISALYEECAVRFQWQHGDVVMLDNMLAAHARDPFEGSRSMAVAMGDLYQRDKAGSDITPYHDEASLTDNTDPTPKETAAEEIA